MIVVVGGMIRSGSTLSFNIVRELLERSGTVEAASANGVPPSALTFSAEHHFILKSHEPEMEVLDRIRSREWPCICTLRDPVEAIDSWMRTFGFPFEHGLESVRRWLAWYVQVADSVLSVEYDMIERQPLRAIESIAEYIDSDVDPELVQLLANKYDKRRLKAQYDSLEHSAGTVDLGFSFYDKETFFHRRHISSLNSTRSETLLSVSQVVTVRQELKSLVARVPLLKVPR